MIQSFDTITLVFAPVGDYLEDHMIGVCYLVSLSLCVCARWHSVGGLEALEGVVWR